MTVLSSAAFSVTSQKECACEYCGAKFPNSAERLAHQINNPCRQLQDAMRRYDPDA